jgi:TctA family transporter
MCVLGTFATNNALFDLWTLAAIGVLVWIMEANDYPAAPMVLGKIVEESFMSSMIKADGNLLGFFERPIAGTLGVITILVWLVPLLLSLRGRRVVRSELS